MAEVAHEVAEQEVEKWLDFKKISPSKRTAKQESIDNLITYIEEGYLALDDKMYFVHTLKFPTDGELPLTTLKYKPRIDIGKLNNRLAKVKGLNIDARLVAYVAALTDQTSAIIEKLDSEDSSIANEIALFFM